MLRVLVVALIVANLGFWAWTSGLFEALGLAAPSERDPGRLALQQSPDAVRVLAPGAAEAALGAGAAPAGELRASVCLEAGPFAAQAIDAAERALASLAPPQGSWQRRTQEIGALHAVVLGPFGNREALQKKREEIGRLNLPFEALDLPGDGGAAPQPAFSLGRYDSREAADAALAGFSERGVRTARVALLRAAGSESRLRVEAAAPTLAEQLRTLGGGASGALGAGFAPCAAPAAQVLTR